MSDAPSTSTPSRASRQSQSLGLSVTAHDRAASLLVAMLVLVGVFVLMLFVLWLTNTISVNQNAVEVELIEPLAGDGSLGDGRDLEEPGEEEVEDLYEPQLEETLTAVTDAISSQRATLETLEGEARSSTSGKGRGGGPAGTGGGAANVVPRYERWQVLFSTTTLEEYARQLDAFQIELGVFGGGSPVIEYAYHFGQNPPQTRTGKSDDEKRIYMTWRQGRLKQADQKLLRRAGIATSGRLHAQFFPPSLENRLARIERDHNPQLAVENIAKTVFGLRVAGKQYEFYVVEQRTRGRR